ncbi:DUF2147 domain-containing protein [uncultured Roseovarius sp.]|uniref:DUF2147 domain-containing protein n=1 Tax=uncultured Roseovarius sp. TaxID=293344 RepID=UPI0026017507|nr:DUF2147 domain-containing protein [uncultured Roseovarius sp.]
MKNIFVTAGAICLFGSALAADPIEGKWRTSKDDNGFSGLIHIAPCGDKLCGRLLKSFNAEGKVFASEFDGKNILTETVPKGDGEYRGRAFSPDRRKTYNSKLKLNGDKLSVSGCILVICRTGDPWTRVE